MNESNNSYPNGVNDVAPLFINSKHFFRDNIRESQLSDAVSLSPSCPHLMMPPIQGIYSHFPVITSSDNVICDEMKDCHLTDSWVNQHVNLPLSHIANQIPILNSYIPHEYHSYQNNLYQQQNYLLHRNYLNRYYLNERYKYVSMTDNNNSVMQAHPQQQLFYDGFSRHAELDYEVTNHQQNNKAESINNIYESSQECHSKETSELNQKNEEESLYDYKMQKIKTCIKFQDRNKKLDFKTNFRDENRKINGCFFDNDKRFSPTNRDKHVAAPKKKWIKNYLTSSAGT